MASSRKRKATGGAVSCPKKPRQEADQMDGGEDTEGSPSSADECDSSIDEASPTATAPTPTTPNSAGRAKNHHCPYPSCDRAYTRPARLEEHVRAHTNERSLVCPEASCGKSYRRISHLKHHIKSAHTAIRDYVCNWAGCSKAFQTGTRLWRHIATHEKKEEFRCRVEGCGMTFRKHGTLEKHTKSVHEGRRPFTCTIIISQEETTGASEITCNSGFETAAKLKDHKARMHCEKRYACDLCSDVDKITSTAADSDAVPGGTWFATHSLLQSHIKTVHPPTCPQCSANLPSKSALSSHIEVHHEMSLTERQSHFCPEPHCERGFTSKGNLTLHVKAVHLQRKDFVCGQIDLSGAKGIPEDWNTVGGCGAKFSSKGNLLGHFRTVHLSQKRKAKKVGNGRAATKVPQAPQPALGPSDLVRSLTSRDTVEQFLACLEPFCLTRFSDSDALFVHLQAVHGIACDDVEGSRGDYGRSRLPTREGIDGGEASRNELHRAMLAEEDDIAERALRALREELQMELIPIDPMLC